VADEAGGKCDRCGRSHGPDPFIMRLDPAQTTWQRFTFCPKCAGAVCRDLIGYLAAMKKKLQPGLF